MFNFLNLTLHSFGPDNFVPLVEIGKFQNGLIEKNEIYKMGYYTWSTLQFFWGKKSSETKPHELLHQPYMIISLHITYDLPTLSIAKAMQH
jgi:hypothetical protein